MVAKATAALNAEREAAEAEGIFQPTDEQRKALKRWKALDERERAIKAEKAAIATMVFGEMDEVGARALTVNGKNWVLFSTVNRKVVDEDKMVADHPELVLSYREILSQYTRTVPEIRRTVKPV